MLSKYGEQHTVYWLFTVNYQSIQSSNACHQLSLGNFLTLYTSTHKEEKVLRHLNFLVFFCLYMTYLQLSRCRRPSILSFSFIYLFIFKLLLINVMKSSKLKELEEGVINVRRSTEDTSKENTTKCSSERKPVSLAFFNVSSKNKCI